MKAKSAARAGAHTALHSPSPSPADPRPEDSQTAVDIDRLFHALGDRTRRAILDRLRAGAVSVTQLAQPLGITLTAVGQHLEILEAVRLVTTEKVGRVRTCRIASAGLDALDRWVRGHRTVWEHRVEALADLLEEEAQDPGR